MIYNDIYNDVKLNLKWFRKKYIYILYFILERAQYVYNKYFLILLRFTLWFSML